MISGDVMAHITRYCLLELSLTGIIVAHVYVMAQGRYGASQEMLRPPGTVLALVTHMRLGSSQEMWWLSQNMQWLIGRRRCCRM